MKPKRPRDVVGNAGHVAKIATGEIQEGAPTRYSFTLDCKKPNKSVDLEGEQASSEEADSGPRTPYRMYVDEGDRPGAQGVAEHGEPYLAGRGPSRGNLPRPPRPKRKG